MQALLAAAVAATSRAEEILDWARPKRASVRIAVVALLGCLATGLAVDLRLNLGDAEIAYGVDDLPDRSDPIDVAPVFDVEPGRKVRFETREVSANSMTYEFAVLDGLGSAGLHRQGPRRGRRHASLATRGERRAHRP